MANANMLITTAWIRAQMERQLHAELKLRKTLDSGAWLEATRQRWSVKPRHERARIRLRAKIRAARIRLGELIAGQPFED